MTRIIWLFKSGPETSCSSSHHPYDEDCLCRRHNGGGDDGYCFGGYCWVGPFILSSECLVKQCSMYLNVHPIVLWIVPSLEFVTLFSFFVISALYSDHSV